MGLTMYSHELNDVDLKLCIRINEMISKKVAFLRYSLNMTNYKNTVISPNFVVWDFCGKTQFPHPEIRWN